MKQPGAGTVMLLHGAWHDGWCWHAVGERLTAAGVDWVAPDLPLSSYHDDVAAVRTVLDEPGREFLVVGHSRGGVVMSCATSGTTNVRHLVYLTAPMLEPGHGKLPRRRETLRERAVIESAGEYRVDPALAADFLYADCESAVVADAIARLRPTASQTDADLAGFGAGWQDIESTYVVCTEDRCIHPDDQREMSARATHVLELASGHSAPLSQPAAVADLLVGLANRCWPASSR